MNPGGHNKAHYTFLKEACKMRYLLATNRGSALASDVLLLCCCAAHGIRLSIQCGI